MKPSIPSGRAPSALPSAEDMQNKASSKAASVFEQANDGVPSARLDELSGLNEPSALMKAAQTLSSQALPPVTSGVLGTRPDADDILAAAGGGGGGGTHTVTAHGAAIPPGLLRFAQLAGEETLSELFSYIVQLNALDTLNIGYHAPAANLPLKPMVGKDLDITIELDDGSQRTINGLVTAARVRGLQGRNVAYELRIEPWLELATRTSDYKIFQNKTVVDILDEVLSEYPFPMEKRLTQSYPKRVFQVQYGETDYDFLQRLMQEFGIYYYFEHSPGSHKLILIDAIGSHPIGRTPTISYYQEGLKIDREYIHTLSAKESLRTGQWVLNDFDFKKPKAQLKSTVAQPRETGHPDYERYEWPGDYFEKSEGDFLTRTRMEAQRTLGSRFHGAGNVRTLITGTTFTLDNCPTLEANQEYLVLGSSLIVEEIGDHSGQGQGFSYHVDFELQPTTEVFRPQRTIAKPHTRGPQTAIVVGPAGEEIWTDSYGRIKVQFLWDRYGQWDENSSCWIRVSYPWAGKSFGGIQIPRIGQEVIVDFKNGDPDLPIITGRVYNADNMAPWNLPANKTQSGLYSRSIKGGYENANAFRFEDKPGKEEIWLHAEKDQRIEVENDESHWVGNDRKKTIDRDETTTIARDLKHTVQKDSDSLTGTNKTISVVENLTIAAGDTITLSCGRTKLVMFSNGYVALTCTNFNITAMDNGWINTKKGQLDVNMDDRKEWVEIPDQEHKEKEKMQAEITKTFKKE